MSFPVGCFFRILSGLGEKNRPLAGLGEGVRDARSERAWGALCAAPAWMNWPTWLTCPFNDDLGELPPRRQDSAKAAVGAV
jgi:hypothetical protein